MSERWFKWNLVMGDVSELPRIASIYGPIESGVDALASDRRGEDGSIEN